MTADTMVSLTKKKSLLWLLLCFSLILLASSVCAEDKREDWGNKGAPDRSPYYKDRQWGWYWNEKLDKRTEEERQQEKAKISPKDQKSKDRHPSLKDYTYDQIWDMHPDDFQDLTKKIAKKAVQYPTEENVLENIVMNNIAQRKSAAFAAVNMLVNQKHPEYSAQDKYPTNSPGKLALRDEVQDSLNRNLVQSRDDFALIMFTRDGCRFCDAQRSIVDRFLNNMYGWTIREANISNDTTSANLAARFGVENVPSIILVYRQSGQYLPISTGVITFEELRNKLYYSTRYLKGETAPEQYFLYDFQENSGTDPLKDLRRSSVFKNVEAINGKKQ